MVYKTSPCLTSACLISGLFFSPPTHSYTTTLICTQTQPGRGGLVEGVHPPSPSAFAPWSSRRPVACFHAPHRLPAWLNHTNYTCDGAKIRKICYTTNLPNDISASHVVRDSIFKIEFEMVSLSVNSSKSSMRLL